MNNDGYHQYGGYDDGAAVDEDSPARQRLRSAIYLMIAATAFFALGTAVNLVVLLGAERVATIPMTLQALGVAALVAAIVWLVIARRGHREQQTAERLRSDPDFYLELLDALRAAPPTGGSRGGAARSAVRRARSALLTERRVPRWLHPQLSSAADRPPSEDDPSEIETAMRRRGW